MQMHHGEVLAGRRPSRGAAPSGSLLATTLAPGKTAELAPRDLLPGRPWVMALLAGVLYYAGASFGFAMTFAPSPISILWPPNASLLALLTLSAPRHWPLILAAVLPAHLLAELPTGVPLPMVLCWYVSNCAEALIGAFGLRLTLEPPYRLDRLRNVLAFVMWAAFLAPFLSSFLDAGFVVLNGLAENGYAAVWSSRFVSNALAALTIVPPILALSTPRFRALAGVSAARLAEAAALAAAMSIGGALAFVSEAPHATSALPMLLYLPVPILIWAALRFGPLGLSCSFAILVLAIIWGAGHGHGPFRTGTASEDAQAIQLYLISLALPMLGLAALFAEREAVTRRLRSSEERFYLAFHSSPDAISISRSSDGRLLDVNARWVALFGQTRDVALTTRLGDALPFPSRIAERLRNGAPGEGGAVRELEIGARNGAGEALSLFVSVEAIELDGEVCLLTTARDVTPQRRAERDARQQQRQLTHLSRVNLLGELSGALAHEINQPLASILTNAQTAQRYLARQPIDVEQLGEALADIAEADQRAATVIQRLRALLRKGGDGERVSLDLNEVVEEVIDFAHGELITRNVVVRTSFAAGLPRISGDRVQLQQLYLNLVSNACEAMVDVDQSERVMTLTSVLGSGDVVRMEIADRGPGISDDQLRKVFEPFVTTKPNGLGLGLAICRSIVTAHGGRMWARNSPTGGASFLTEFPALR